MTASEKIENLRKKYKRELPAKIALIKRDYELSLENGFTNESFIHFYKSIHSMVGGAATFGINEVSEISKLIELEIYPYIKSETNPSIEDLEKIKELISKLNKISTSIEQDSI